MNWSSKIGAVWLVWAVLLGWLSAGCLEGDRIPCDLNRHCFENERCVGGVCVLQEEAENGNAFNGGNGNFQNNANGEVDDECRIQFPCVSGIDEFDSRNSYLMSPGGDGDLNFGCSGGEFQTEPDILDDVKICSDDHRYLFYTNHCDDREFILEVEVIPLDDQCSAVELADFEFELTGGVGDCADEPSDNYCYHSSRPDHGGILWEGQVPKISQPSTFYPALDVKPHQDASFTYRVEARARTQ